MSDSTDHGHATALALQVAQDAVTYLKRMPLCGTTSSMIRDLESRIAEAEEAAAQPQQLYGKIWHPSGVELLHVHVFQRKARIALVASGPQNALLTNALSGQGATIELHALTYQPSGKLLWIDSPSSESED